MGTRFTSHRNPDSGKYDVLKVVDGDDGSPDSGETTVVASFDTSPEANDKVTELLKDQTTDAEDLRIQNRMESQKTAADPKHRQADQERMASQTAAKADTPHAAKK